MAITDLTNTTWVFNDTITSLPQSPIYITFSASWTGIDMEALFWKSMVDEQDQKGLWAGFLATDGLSISSTGQEQLYLSAFGLWNVDKTITIKGGVDAGSPTFIQWLEANAVQQGVEPEPTPKLYIGNKAVTSMSIGNKAILKMYVGNSLIYEKASGEESVSITLNCANGGLNNMIVTYIKFGTTPTTDDDFDYQVSYGSRTMLGKEGNVGEQVTIDVAPTAYVWQSATDNKGGYKLNNGSLVNAGVGYTNATQIILNNGDIVTLVSTGLD